MKYLLIKHNDSRVIMVYRDYTNEEVLDIFNKIVENGKTDMEILLGQKGIYRAYTLVPPKFSMVLEFKNDIFEIENV